MLYFRYFLCLFLVCLGVVQSQEVSLIFVQGKTLGAARAALDGLFREFERENPAIRVVCRELPNSSDKQHQYYLTSLGGGAHDIDLMALDIIWVSEFAHARWLVPVDLSAEEQAEFFPGTLQACTYQGQLVALPWYTDAGLLYYRRDLLAAYGLEIPQSWTWEKVAVACETILAGEKKKPRSPVKYGYLCQGKHYEGLVCAFLEIFRGSGGEIFEGERVILDNPQGIAAFAQFYDLLHKMQVIPPLINNLDEEESRRVFQAGKAIFLRNWPYVWSNLETSALRGKVGVAPVPHGADATSSATLGGWQLGISVHSRHPKEAALLAHFLGSAKAQKVQALHLSRNPTRMALYRDPQIVAKNPFFQDLYPVFLHASPRPVTPRYPKISQILQREVSQLIQARKEPDQAARDAAREIREIDRPSPSSARISYFPWLVGLSLLALAGLAAMIWRGDRRENLAALAYLAPALLLILLVAIVPLLYAVVLSFYRVEMATMMHPDLWIACGLEHFRHLLADVHFAQALGNTLFITFFSVSLELLFGLGIALLFSRPFLGRGPLRALLLLPWILPTVVAGRMWAWIFAAEGGLANYLLGFEVNWMSSWPAVVSIIFAEVWKCTPFVAILLIAGLTTIPEDLYRAARVDGATSWQIFIRITLPLLQPTILLTLLFRTMDALRIFDVVYAMTQYEESTQTLSIYVQQTLGTGDLGYASALSLATFGIILVVSLVYLSLLGKKMGVK